MTCYIPRIFPRYSQDIPMIFPLYHHRCRLRSEELPIPSHRWTRGTADIAICSVLASLPWHDFPPDPAGDWKTSFHYRLIIISGSTSEFTRNVLTAQNDWGGVQFSSSWFRCVLVVCWCNQDVSRYMCLKFTVSSLTSDLSLEDSPKPQTGARTKVLERLSLGDLRNSSQQNDWISCTNWIPCMRL